MNTLTIIRGPLGVGKTTITKRLSEILSIEYISVDEVLDQLQLDTTNGIPVEHFLKVNEVIENQIHQHNTPAIVDGNFYYQAQIDDLTKKFPNDHHIITLTSDVETCIKRDAEREKSYGEESTRFVYNMTMRIRIGTEIDCTNDTVEEVVNKIVNQMGR